MFKHFLLFRVLPKLPWYALFCGALVLPSTGYPQSSRPSPSTRSANTLPSGVRASAHATTLPSGVRASARTTTLPSQVDGWLRDLGDDDWRIRKRGILALSQRGLAVVPALIERLGDDEEMRRQSATAVLYRIGQPALPFLRKALDHPKAWTRQHAAFAMGLLKIADYRVIEVLFEALRDPDEHIRKFAKSALFVLSPAARDVLEQALLAKAPETRALAAGVLQRCGAAAIPALRRVLRDPDEEVRIAAIMSLAHFGPQAHAARPDLLRALRDPSSRIRRAAQTALQALSANPPQHR